MWTIPNALTALRAAGIPLFLWLVAGENFGWAVLTLMFAGATDYFDGKLARAWGQESRFGELMDPAVDRLYIASVLIAMYLTDALPAPVLYLIVARDLILAALLVLMRRKGLPPFQVTYLGKAATFNLLYALPLLLLTFAWVGFWSDLAFVTGWAFAGWGIGLYLWTGVSYARSGIVELRGR
jgi:cardiolipin synthase